MRADGAPPIGGPRLGGSGARDNGKAAAAARLLASARPPSDDGGEDELEAFPLPNEPRATADRVPAVRPGAGIIPSETAADAWARFRTPVASLPAAIEEEAKAPVTATAVAERPQGTLDPEAPLAVAVSEVLAPSAGGGASGGGDDGGRGGAPTGGAGGTGGGRRPRRARLLELSDRPMSIFEHLDELRRRLMWCALAFVLGIAVTFPFLNAILKATYNKFHVHLQLIAPMEGMFGGMRIAVIGGVTLAAPVIVYQIVAFVVPALTAKERRLLVSYLPASVVLFILGLTFGYEVFEPMLLRVSQHFFPWVPLASTLQNWVSFLVSSALPFGGIFEMPVIAAILTKLGIITPQLLMRGRRWAIIGAVVLGLAFTPGDTLFISPSLVALPIIILYEGSIIVARIAYRQVQRERASGEQA